MAWRWRVLEAWCVEDEPRVLHFAGFRQEVSREPRQGWEWKGETDGALEALDDALSEGDARPGDYVELHQVYRPHELNWYGQVVGTEGDLAVRPVRVSIPEDEPAPPSFFTVERRRPPRR